MVEIENNRYGFAHRFCKGLECFPFKWNTISSSFAWEIEYEPNKLGSDFAILIRKK
jgi:hypothetical protein|tara:strand:- start:873 stop:1040 length:168 start_codon:yes stop_codon:yes gene_type:complete